jgi:hypothetical protein
MRNPISNFTSTFTGLLGAGSSTEKASTQQEEIRTAMLAALSEIESSHPGDFSRTLVTITQANDVESLWYARSELLRLIADRDGELGAIKVLDGITDMFKGLVPQNQMPVKKKSKR